MKRLALALLLVASPAFAAKVPVSWTNPTTNTDGSALTNLASVTVQWGSCSGGAFGTLQSAVTVKTSTPGAKMSAFAYPVGLALVCVRAFATNSAGASSAYSSVATWTPPAALGQPVAIVLHFGKRHDS